ncbi:MAG: hypothetical protein IMZ44_25875 [Planctomycetes bacterium]|nr:hypothetical protein [Planctomycetota bacterium]
MTEGNDGKTNAPPTPTEAAQSRAAALWAIWWPMLRTMLSLLRRSGLRLFLIAFVMSLLQLATVPLMVPVTWVLQHCGIESPMYWWPTLALFGATAMVLSGPIAAGYSLIVHQVLGGEKGRVLTLFVGFRTLRLFLRLATVSVALFLSDYGLNLLWSYLPWDFCWDYFSNIVTPGSPLDELLGHIPALGWFIGEFHFATKTLILLPIQWALLEVIIGGKSWPKALAGSARLAWRHKHLALLLLGVVLVLSLDTWLRALLPHRQDYFEGYSYIVYWLVDWGGLAGHAAITCAVTTVNTAALVVIYHAMRTEAAPTAETA